MENEPAVTVAPELSCPACCAVIKEEDFFCKNCGCPIKAPAEERDDFIRNRNYNVLVLQEMQKKISNASTSIFVISAFTAVAAVILYFTTPESLNPLAVMITNLIVAVIFFGLGFWCKKQPVAAIVSALTLYVILWIVAIIQNPLNVFSGIIIKIIIIVYLIKGLTSAFEAQKIKKANSL